jgi:predicted dehydrogenase
MIAYRMQYDVFSQEAMRIARSRELGKPKLFTTEMTQTQGDPNQWRMKKALAGGGSLPDIGIYCLNTARFLRGEEPSEVQAQIYTTPGDPRFKEVEEYVSFVLQFPGGWVAQCSCSYGAHRSSRYRFNFDAGWFDSDPSYFYEGQQFRVSRKVSETAEDASNRRLQHKNQFAAEIDHMAECILTDRRPRTPGEEGLQDHIIMEAIYKSAQTRQPVALESMSGVDVTRGPALPNES